MIHDKYFGLAADEISRRDVEKDTFARAYAMALGDDARAKSIYITLRAAKMQESATAGDKLAKRANAEKEKHEKSENRKRMRAAALAVELAAQAAESDAVKARNAEDMKNGLLYSFVTTFLKVILVGSLLGPPIVWIMYMLFYR